MQVADRTEHVTHAVLGGMSNISFGISDDPAFFQILSSALYKDPTLAMIREIICNAWDAHIDSGREDRHITITIDSEKLVIRDYGKGIPHDLIGPVYGVYGASTKKNDGRQTGGFGLGCKSPFAYTDHFEVVSFHDGVRTIYNMSKSSAEKMGKPSIVPIASFVTDETGIQVTVELTSTTHESHLTSLIGQVVFNGDINATLNGVALPKLGLTHAEAGFILINDRAETTLPTQSFNGHSAFVRYGNVIYPIETNVEIEPLFNKVTNVLSKLYSCRVVLMAPPDSISITPSRESLTMSPITVETLKTLFSNFLAHMMHNREITKRHLEIVKECIDTASAKSIKLADKLNFVSWKVPGIPESHKNKFLSTTEDFAQLGVLLKFSGKSGQLSAGQWLSTMKQYLGNLSKAGSISRGLTQTWLETARKCKKKLNDPKDYYYHFNVHSKHRDEHRYATSWWNKRIMLPLFNKLSAAAGHSVRDCLYYRSSNQMNAAHKNGWSMPMPIRSVQLKNHTSNLVHLLKPTVFLCHNHARLPSRIGYGMLSNTSGTYQAGSYFVLEIPRKEDITQKMKKVLEDLGDAGEIEFIDMTGRTASEQTEYENRLEATAAKRQEYLKQNPTAAVLPRKAKAGLVRLDQLLKSPSDFDTRRMTLEDGIQRLTKPLFIEKVSTAKELKSETFDFKGRLLLAVSKLWGHLGVVTNNTATLNKHITENKVMSLEAFVVDKVVTEIITSPTLIAHMAFDAQKVETYFNSIGKYHHSQTANSVYKTLLNNPEFNSLVPNYIPLTIEDHYKLIIWHEMLNDYHWNQDPAIKQAADSVKDLELSQSTKDFLDGLISNPFLGLIDQDNLDTIARGSRKDPVKMAKIKAILSEIIN